MGILLHLGTKHIESKARDERAKCGAPGKTLKNPAPETQMASPLGLAILPPNLKRRGQCVLLKVSTALVIRAVRGARACSVSFTAASVSLLLSVTAFSIAALAKPV